MVCRFGLGRWTAWLLVHLSGLRSPASTGALFQLSWFMHLHVWSIFSASCRNVRQYPEAEAVPGLLLARVGAPIYFANTQHIVEHLRKFEARAQVNMNCVTKHPPPHRSETRGFATSYLPQLTFNIVGPFRSCI